MKNAVESKESVINVHNELIEGCKKGDQKAQFQIYKLYYKAMYNTSIRIINDPMEAEDIMQESFLTAFEEIGNYSGKVSFGAWLKKIVQNRSIDAWRKKSKINFEEIGSANESEFICFESANCEEEHDSRFNKVIEALKHLTKGCRQVFSLYFLEGFDHEEIGEILSISASSSRSQLSRARNGIIQEVKSERYSNHKF